MIKEAIILAGGLGTRLRPVIPGVPKCMAPVAGRPFLFYVMDHLQKHGIVSYIFSLGYKYEMITAWLKKQYPELNITWSVEEEPLGTGGAVKLACSLATAEDVLVLNGDTFFKIDPGSLSSFHKKKEADCTLSLKPMQGFERYGVVELDTDGSICSFKEKQYYESGLVNGGIYALHRNRFLQEDLPQKFSFEKDYLERYFKKRRMFGMTMDEYFIDIGIPEDYTRANKELHD